MQEIIGIWINCPSETVADDIAVMLLSQRLVASANRYPAILSRYAWKGQAETAEEIPLLVKTRRMHFDAVVDAVRPVHPYETPAITAVEIMDANRDYADWVYAETITA